jgi:O-antigen/teichoic acid export membrane protein
MRRGEPLTTPPVAIPSEISGSHLAPGPLGVRVRLGVTWLALAQIIRRLSGLAVTAVLARLLLPGDLGLMALATLSTQLLGLISELGLTTALVQRKAAGDRDLATGFWLTMSVSIAMATLGILSADLVGVLFHEPRIASLLRVTMLAVPIAACGQVSDVLLQRRLDFKRIANIDWVSAVLSGIIGIALALAGAGVWALVAQLLSATIVTMLLRQYFSPWRPTFEFDAATSRQLLRYGLAMVAVGLINYVSINVDSMLIGGKLGTSALGYYVLAFNLALLPATNIGGLVTRVMFPALAALQAEPRRFREAYLRMLRAVAIATFPIIVGLGATAHLAIPLVYGPRWVPAIAILQILAIVGVFQAVNVSGVVYSALGRPYLLLVYATFSTTVMAVSFFVGARYGVRGVAWSWVIVSPLVCIPPHMIANRMIGLLQRDFWRALLIPLVASLLMGVGVQLADRQLVCMTQSVVARLVMLVPLGAILYALAISLLLMATGQDRNLLRWAGLSRCSRGDSSDGRTQLS